VHRWGTHLTSRLRHFYQKTPTMTARAAEKRRAGTILSITHKFRADFHSEVNIRQS
jgi:hypothetical protein